MDGAHGAGQPVVRRARELLGLGPGEVGVGGDDGEGGVAAAARPARPGGAPLGLRAASRRSAAAWTSAGGRPAARPGRPVLPVQHAGPRVDHRASALTAASAATVTPDGRPRLAVPMPPLSRRPPRPCPRPRCPRRPARPAPWPPRPPPRRGPVGAGPGPPVAAPPEVEEGGAPERPGPTWPARGHPEAAALFLQPGHHTGRRRQGRTRCRRSARRRRCAGPDCAGRGHRSPGCPGRRRVRRRRRRRRPRAPGRRWSRSARRAPGTRACPTRSPATSVSSRAAAPARGLRPRRPRGSRSLRSSRGSRSSTGSNAEASETLGLRRHREGLQGSRPDRRARHRTSRPRRTSRSNRGRRWPTGRTASCYLHGSTQSVARTVASVAGWVGIKPEELVLISEFTGGGFGSKIPGAQSMAIPALLSKKLNGRPVMMRISREEETYIGRTRPGYPGLDQDGLQEGRPRHRDRQLHRRRQRSVSPPGRHAQAANLATLMYQAPNMRFRGLSVATNTPPRVSQRAPGGLQASMIVRAARRQGGEASSASIRSRSARSTRRKGRRSSASSRRRRRPARPRSQGHQLLRQGSARQGRRAVQLGRAQEARAASARGSKVTGVAVGHRRLHRRLDRRRWPLRHQAGRQAVHPPGHRQSRHALGDRHRARHRRECSTCRGKSAWWSGATPATGVRVELDSGRQPDDLRSHPRQLRGRRRRSSASCRSWRRRTSAARPTATTSATSGVPQGQPRPRMTWAQGGGARDQARRQVRRPRGAEGTSTRMTKASAERLAGMGLMGVARDNLPRDGQTYSFRAALHRESKWTSRPASTHRRLPGGGGRRHGDAPEQPRRTDSRRRDPGHRPRAQPEAGLRPALRRGARQRGCTTTSRRRSSTSRSTPMRWAAVELPDPSNPGRRQGHRRTGHRRRRRARCCARWPTRSATTTS